MGEGLPTATLGSSGLAVTRLGYGAMSLRGAGSGYPAHLDRAAAGRLLNAVLDAGINFIDSAPVYGVTEELIGEHLSHRREEYLLATKIGFAVGQLPVLEPRTRSGYLHDWSPEGLREELDWSLRTLRTDHIDVLQVASSPPLSSLVASGAMDVLLELQRAGKFTHLGVTGVTATDIEAQVGGGRYATVQLSYSVLDPLLEAGMRKAAAEGLGVIVRGGVAQGSLSGETERLRIARSERRESAASNLLAWSAAGLDDLLEGEERTTFLLRATLSHPDVHTTIVGTSRIEHLQDNLDALRRGPLDASTYGELRRRLAAVIPA
ncbi:MAG TPA: aldo/keto reductase [Acidimicrobiales bacterium]|nr:aldo/keto reductase [Acidimicrobiales bacterium]